jgi:hypothetical protein
MSAEAFFGNMPYLATMPSCALYLRPTGANGGPVFRDWSPQKNAISAIGSPANSTGSVKFPPVSIGLNGSSGLKIPSISAFSLSADILLSVWINETSLANVGFLCLTGSNDVNSWNGNGIQYLFQTTNTSGTSSFQWGSEPANTLDASTNFSANTWNNVIAYVLGSTAYLYLNGTQVGNKPFTYISGTPTYLTAGCNGLSHNFVTGYMDEIAIWSKSLGVIPTPAQVYAAGTSRRLIVG